MGRIDLSQSVCWVTGASSGIGLELARQLVRKGSKVVLTARRADELEALRTEFPQQSDRLAVIPADLTQSERIPALCEQAWQAFGRLDVVVHNAGISQRSLADHTQPEVYRKLMEINYFAPAAITAQLLPRFKAQAKGHFVVISSVAGLFGVPLRTGYAAAKHAVKGHFEALQTELYNSPVGCTLVFPGRINTPISLSALTGSGEPHNKMDAGQLNGIPVEQCAREILRALERRKRRVFIAREEKVLFWFWKWWPALYYKIAANTEKSTLTHSPNA